MYWLNISLESLDVPPTTSWYLRLIDKLELVERGLFSGSIDNLCRLILTLNPIIIWPIRYTKNHEDHWEDESRVWKKYLSNNFCTKNFSLFSQKMIFQDFIAFRYLKLVDWLDYTLRSIRSIKSNLDLKIWILKSP